MKLLLGIGLLLFLNAQTVFCVANWTKRATAEELGEFIEALNAFRRKIAYSYDVANMNELMYDSNLQIAAGKMRTCNDVRGSSNFVPYLPPNAEAWDKVENWNLKNAQEEIRNQDPVTLVRFGFSVLLVQPLMHPLQTRIGCAEFKEGCISEFDDQAKQRYQIDQIKYDTICLLGPVSAMGAEVVQKGAAGSQCESGKSKDGLCQSSQEYIDFESQIGIGEQSAAVSSAFPIDYALSIILAVLFFHIL